jgi:hypothetical protein
MTPLIVESKFTCDGIIDVNTILGFTNHGTVKIVTVYPPKSDRTKDVSRIEVIK